MKIIGTTKDGFLLSATKTEVANLAGRYSEYDLHRDMPEIGPGSTIDVSALFHHRRKMEESVRERQQIANNLRTAADLIDATMPKPKQPKAEEEE